MMPEKPRDGKYLLGEVGPQKARRRGTVALGSANKLHGLQKVGAGDLVHAERSGCLPHPTDKRVHYIGVELASVDDVL